MTATRSMAPMPRSVSFGEVLVGVAAGEDAAVDGGVEGLDAAVEHFGGAGDGFDFEDGIARRRRWRQR